MGLKNPLFLFDVPNIYHQLPKTSINILTASVKKIVLKQIYTVLKKHTFSVNITMTKYVSYGNVDKQYNNQGYGISYCFNMRLLNW